jgi:hypothetical protein
MQATVKQTEGHYDVQEVPFGMVYKWRPEHSVECGCGEILVLSAYSITTCRRCGADYAAYVPEELADGRLVDEILHPWRYAKAREEDGLPF